MKIVIVSLTSFLGGVVVTSVFLGLRMYRSTVSQSTVLAETTNAIPNSMPTFIPSPIPSLTPSPSASSSASLKPRPTSTVPPKPTPTSSPTSTPTLKPTAATPAWLEEYFDKFASEYTVDKSVLTKIADCESHFNTESRNGDYVGMFQFATQTWITHRTAMGLDPTESKRTSGEESIRTAAFVISRYGTGPWANCAL